MRWSTLRLTLALASLAPSAAHAQYRRGRQPLNNDYTRWDTPLQGGDGSEAQTAPLVTYGTIAVGTLTVGNLVENETHYLQFHVAEASHCMLESEDNDDSLQIAYLDDATRVLAVGLYAEIKPGSYFIRLRSRGKVEYKLTLNCAAAP